MASAGTMTITMTGGTAGASIGPDVVVSEIMINPRDVYDSRGEWIELTNRGDESDDLEGWTITDGKRDRVTLPALTIAPGERVVLTRTADAYTNGGAEPDWVYGNALVLLNRGDRIILSDEDGKEIDRVDWHPGSGIEVPSGRSLAMRDILLDNDAVSTWCPSTTIMTRGDLGSPGAPNECGEPAEPLVITEILQNPRRTSDYAGEFFEVFNDGDQPVDMAGWTVKDDDGDRFTVDAPLVVAPGGYAVFGIATEGNGAVGVDYAYGRAMRLHNDFDELVIADTHGIQVDRVRWDNGRSFPDPNGASMSLIDPGEDNLQASNWCTATTPWAYGDLGTPGEPTWCTAPGASPIVITEVMFDPETPTGERAAEWFELANLGDRSVDLDGWTVTAGDWKVHTIDSLKIEPGEFAVLAASDDTERNGDVTPQYVYGTEPDLPLYNRSSRIVLTDRDGAIVDRVDWSADRLFPIPSGHSITLGFPSADNALGPNWCASTARWAGGDFGSPGTLGTCEAPPAPPAVSIVEIMRNPAAVSDSDGEWFELRNATPDDVDLRGWSVGDGDSDLHVIETSVVLPAGGYAVLGRSADASRNGGAVIDYAYADSVALTNDADTLSVSDQYGQPVDTVRWDRAWLRPNGASVANVPDGWCVSGPQYGLGDLGTPGAPNDCTPLEHRDVVISELHVDPRGASDTVGEWIELTNHADQPIDINGWHLRDDDAGRHTIDRGDPWVLQPGDTAVLGRDLDPAINGDVPVDYSFGADFPLTNSEDEVTLLDAELVWVDRVTWTVDRPLPFTSGSSASLRELSADNSVAANWCTSVTEYGSRGDHGTPGAANTCVVPPPPSTTVPSTTVPPTTVPPTTVPTTSVPPTTAPTGEAKVRVTAMCAAVDGEHEGRYKFRVRHESGPGPLGYRLQIAGNVLHTGTIDVAEVQFVWLPIPSRGVKVIPDGDWTNRYRGTASTNSKACAPTTPATSTTTTTVPPTTTAPPTSSVPPDRPETSGFGLLALADAACKTGLKLTGSSISVAGGIRSNGDVLVQGSDVVVDGPISHGGKANIGHRVGSTGVVQDGALVLPTLPWTFEALAGRATSRHAGDWTVSGGTVEPGIHLVDGDVTISGSAPDLTGVTIVATGKVTISGGVTMSPFEPGLPSVFTTQGSCDDTAIGVSGSSVSWSGALIAPNGKVQVNGSSLHGDHVLAATIQLSGSRIELG